MGQPIAPEQVVKPQIESAGAPASFSAMPTPARLFQTFNAYQQTAAMRAAIDLDVFTAIADRQTTAEQIAERTGAAARGVRILCDYLTVMGFLTKDDSHYGLAPDAAVFLDRRSPAYMGGAARFLDSPVMLQAFDSLTDAVRKGGTMMGEEGTVGYENPIWVDFARSMAPMMMMPAELISKMVNADQGGKMRVLDIAAGHGLFGINIARHNPQAEITAVDWASVLEVARENAIKSGVESRYSTTPGSAFDVEFGEGYDVVLLTNFLHHFDVPTCEGLLRKVRAALAPQGRAVTLEFVPNDDRVTPPEAATFSMIMLGSTPHGDAYTFAEFDRMFKNAGFTRSEHFRQPPMPESVIISHK
ncbi:MAG TPA: class I SAM-dependent methyltransferase [Terriglobia bacterium]|nr:class I SAM-dependent methyltransferase [Terriglobia bacterium]